MRQIGISRDRFLTFEYLRRLTRVPYHVILLVSKLIQHSSTYLLRIIPAEAQSSVCTTKAETVGQNYINVCSLRFQSDVVALGMILLMHANEVERGGKDALINVSARGHLSGGSAHHSSPARSIQLRHSQQLQAGDQLRLSCCLR